MPQDQFNLAQDDDKLADYKNRKEAFKKLPESAKTSVTKKSKDHMDKYGDDSRKKTTKEILAVVWWRGRGAYYGNPSSVRPMVTSAEQWAMARVNGFLHALRTLKFKRKPFDTDLLPKDHPKSTKGRSELSTESLNESNSDEIFIEKYLDEEDLQDIDIFLDLSAVRAVGDIDPTNFPAKDDDKKVSLRNSQWSIFPISFAEKIKNDYPEIWKKGGNIRGNSQYRKLVPIHERGGYPETNTEEHAIRLREAWVARHFEDFRIAGVIAQIKWLAVGSRGLQYMKDLVREEMKKIDDKSKKVEGAHVGVFVYIGGVRIVHKRLVELFHVSPREVVAILVVVEYVVPGIDGLAVFAETSIDHVEHFHGP